MDQDPPNFGEAKRHLNEYFKLNVLKPSLLHTCFLQLADRMAKEGKLSMGVFVKIWGLDNLRPEDYESFIADDGKSYPSLAERVVQHASKDAFVRNSVEDLNYIFPFINDCITKYPDNIWLKLSKARTLIKLGRNDEALSFGLEVVKSKVNDYWAWELLGDIQQTISEDTSLSCYCKALLCSNDINFVSKVKVKLAALLASRNDYSRAKLEIAEVVNYRNKNNQKLPVSIGSITSKEWYESIEPSSSNLQFYKDHAPQAEELLYSDLLWINGILGECFTIGSKSNTSKRIIYIQSSDIPFEVSVPEAKISITEAKHGTGVRIKGEYDNKNRFQIYTVKNRDDSADWDIFNEHIGVVDHVNNSKKVIHFIVNRNIDAVVPFSALEDEFEEGSAIAVRISKYTSKQGTRYRTLTAQKTNEPIPDSLLKTFEDVVRESNGMGFTDKGIFIPPPLVRYFNIKDGDTVSGKAVLNYDKKRFEWGWKAISVDEIRECP